MVSFPPVSPPRPYTPPSPHPYAPHAQPISFFSILSPAQYWVRSTDLFSSSLCNLLHSPVTSSLLGPNILLNRIFSNALSFLSSLHVSDQVSHPYKGTGKIIVLHILIFKYILYYHSQIVSGVPFILIEKFNYVCKCVTALHNMDRFEGTTLTTVKAS